MPAVIVRSTTGLEFNIDRAIRDKGHEACKGWTLLDTGEVICRCKKLSFPVREVETR